MNKYKLLHKKDMMKIFLPVILVCAIAVSLVACGNKSTNNDSSNSQSVSTKQNSYYGKVTAIAGNEIELTLAKEKPEILQSFSPSEGESESMVGEYRASVNMGPIGGGIPLDGTGEDIGAENRQELELTDETKTFVVPSGLAIKDFMGNEKQLSDIDKSSVLSIMVDQADNVTEVVMYE